MSALPPRPNSGARAAHPPAQNQKIISGHESGEPIDWPTKNEALGLYEFFKVGTRKEVILLGEKVDVVVHHVNSKSHKILCTASTGVCEACQICGASKDVSDPQPEVHFPALRKEKDRRFHQCIAVFTLKQFEEHIEPLTTEEGARGLRIEVYKANPKKAEIKTVKGSPRSRAASLPGAFDLLPWARGRWNRPQDPFHPPVRLDPVDIRDSERGPGRPVQQLALTAGDRMSADEVAAARSKMDELMRSRWSAPQVATPIDPPAPTPAPRPAPVPSAPVAAPAPAPRPAPVPSAPAPRPAPVPSAPAAVEAVPQPAPVVVEPAPTPPTPAAPPTLPPAPPAPAPVLPTAFSAAAFTLTVPAPSAPPAVLFVAPPPPPPPPPVPPAPTPAGFVVVAPPVCPAPLGRTPAPVPPAPVPPPSIPLDTAAKIEADLNELAERFPARASTGMVPPIGRVIAGQQAQIRQRLAEAHAEENRRRAEVIRRARDGHDPGHSPPQGLGGALDAIISAVAKGGAQ